MTPHDITMMFLALGILLAAGRGLGDLAKRLNQPEVVGEILAGILLGPTILGALAPGLTASLFPAQGSIAIALTSLTALGITLFLLVAGLEVDFSTMRRHGRVAVGVGFWGMVIPFAVGFSAALLVALVLVVVKQGAAERELHDRLTALQRAIDERGDWYTDWY